VDERIRFVALALEDHRHFSSLCADFGISRQTGYRWLYRYHETKSFAALSDHSHKPNTSPEKTPDEIEERVLVLRKQNGWGAKKLQIKLQAMGIELSVSTINRILRRRGVMRRKDAHQPALQRFEREEPNELWQMDYKGRFKVHEGYCYPLSIVDDHSRFALCLNPLRGTDGESAYSVLIDTMKRYGVPKAILSDHGTPWWNTNSGDGITWLSVQLIKQGIDLYHGAFRHPQTQGKVEAFHRTLNRAFDHHGLPKTMADSADFFESFVHTYNYERPHEGIGMQVPDQRYQPSTTTYNPSPAPWCYPSEYTVLRVNSQGSITFKGRRPFVARPLANEEVAVQEVDDKLLVMYRHSFVREVDLKTGETRAFIQPIHDGHYLEV